VLTSNNNAKNGIAANFGMGNPPEFGSVTATDRPEKTPVIFNRTNAHIH
jgi:hypothetical protein